MISSNKRLKLCKAAMDTVGRSGMGKYSSKFSRKDYTQQQHAVLLCMQVKSKQSYREFVEETELMLPVLELLGMDRMPHFTTLNKAFLRMGNKILGMLLVLSSQECREASIDASGFDRRHSSRHYTRRCGMHVQSIKVTLVVGTNSLSVLAVHSTTTRKHDSQIVLPLVNNTPCIRTLYADSGYDSRHIRSCLRQHGIRPVIKHRVFKPLDDACNKRLVGYGKRNMSESVNSMIKRKYRDFVSSRNWRSQFKEIMMMCIVHNLERSIQKIVLIIEVFYRTILSICCKQIAPFAIHENRFSVYCNGQWDQIGMVGYDFYKEFYHSTEIQRAPR